MRNILYPLVVLFLLAGSFSTLSAQKLSKEEKKFWKDKAKKYVKNPGALKGEFEGFNDQIKGLKEQLKQAMENGGSGGSDQVDSLRWALIQAEGKLQKAQGEADRLNTELASRKNTSELGIQDGLVYRVQIGAYVFYEMENPPEGANDFVSEQSDGFNKYAVGSFRGYDDAVVFRDELRKMGMGDAWIVPYINGIRSTIDEAEAYRQNEGGSSLLNNN